MKNLHLKVFLSITFFLLQVFAINSSVTLSTNTSNITSTDKISGTNSIVIQNPHFLQTNIVMINYANISELNSGIASSLPSTINVRNGGQMITYTMIYHFIFPNTSFVNNFINFVNSVSTPNSPTVDLNQTALKYQAVNNKVQNIFIDKNGTAIDGLAVQDWLWTNGQQFKSPSVSYQIFLLNLTFIPDKLYWFNIPEPDEVTHQQRQEWRLEWDYPPFMGPNGIVNNYNVKFPYPGYSSQYPMYFLDPSAFNWYLNWTRIWRNVPSTDQYREYLNSFAYYVHKIGGLTNSNNENLAGTFIGDWLNEIVRNLFVFNPLNYVSSPPSVTLQVAVLTDESPTNPYPDLHWIINNTIVKDQIQNVLPNAAINVQTNFYNISNYPDVQNLLNTNKLTVNPLPMANYTYYDGNALFSDFINLDSEFFNQTTSALTLRGYILILNNASFTEIPPPWNGGGLFTGLGGGGRLLILNEVDRLFFNRTTNPVGGIPKESLSKVLIHETGHAIGFPHPFNEQLSQYASDFIGDVMGYYPSTANFSTLFMDNFQRLNLESKVNLIYSNLKALVTVNLSSDYLNNLLTNYTAFLDAYRSLDFQLASTYLNTLQTLMSQEMVLEPNGVQPPIFLNAPKPQTITIGSNVSLSWQVFDSNPGKYAILLNDSAEISGSLNQTSFINYLFHSEVKGSFNISLIAYNRFDNYSMRTVFINVINPPPHKKALSSFLIYTFPIALFSLTIFKRKKHRRT